MTGRHVRADAPHPASFLAFLVTAARILDEEERPPLWLPPTPMDGAANPGQALFWKRWNSTLVAVEAKLKANALAQLEAAGVEPSNTTEPLVAALVEQQRRGVMAACDQAKASDAAAPLKSHMRIIAGICRLVRAERGLSHNDAYGPVASLLRRGVPHPEAWSFSRDDARRDERSYHSALAQLCNAAPDRREVFIQTEHLWAEAVLEPLCWMYERSREHLAYRRHEGEALALAIAEHRGIGRHLEHIASLEPTRLGGDTDTPAAPCYPVLAVDNTAEQNGRSSVAKTTGRKA